MTEDFENEKLTLEQNNQDEIKEVHSLYEKKLD
jgi:hypothetical protein